MQISGLGILIAGILVLADSNDYRHFLEDEIQGPPVVLIVTGTVIFFIAFLGYLIFTIFKNIHNAIAIEILDVTGRCANLQNY